MTQHKSPVPSILVVDDEPVVRGTVVRVLGGWGFRVHEAETGESAKFQRAKFDRYLLPVGKLLLKLAAGQRINRAGQLKNFKIIR
mgnify:CR=1 FL=1